MFTEVLPLFTPDADPYASAKDVLEADDLIELDVRIRRWYKNGKALKMRVKALSLTQQDAINTGSLVKNPKTGEWETSVALYCALTIEHAVIVPGFSKEQARGMPDKNPTIIREFADLIWLLSALDATDVEKAAYALSPNDPQAAPADTGGSDAPDDPPAA